MNREGNRRIITRKEIASSCNPGMVRSRASAPTKHGRKKHESQTQIELRKRDLPSGSRRRPLVSFCAELKTLVYSSPQWLELLLSASYLADCGTNAQLNKRKKGCESNLPPSVALRNLPYRNVPLSLWVDSLASAGFESATFCQNRASTLCRSQLPRALLHPRPRPSLVGLGFTGAAWIGLPQALLGWAPRVG